ncbi:MAG: TolC family protein [Deltaproteobacteria bacterium]|nr:TolC family protein [Deltaproteobacteria bacterium]
MRTNRWRAPLFKAIAPFIFAAAALFSPMPSIAAEASVRDLVIMAREKNPELKALSERARAARSRARAEGALDDPTLKVELEDLSTDDPLSISPSSAMLTRYTVSQMFPFPGKRSLKRRMAEKEALSMDSELKAKALEIETGVKEAYYEVAFLKESIQRTAEIKELLSYMAKVAETRYATGQVSQQDVIKVNVETTMLSNDLITMEAEKAIAVSRLKSLIGLDQSDEVAEPSALPKGRVEFSTDGLIRRAVQENPEVRMVEYEAEANELGVDLARKDYWPDLMVGVAPIQRDGAFDNYDLMFQINLPIWRSKYDARHEEASANASALRARAASMKNMKAFEVKEAALMVEAADRMRTLFETSLVPQVELAFESALKNYQTGKIDFLALLDTERDLKRTRIEYFKSLLEYNKRVSLLEKASGEDLRAGRILPEAR